MISKKCFSENKEPIKINFRRCTSLKYFFRSEFRIQFWTFLYPYWPVSERKRILLFGGSLCNFLTWKYEIRETEDVKTYLIFCSQDPIPNTCSKTREWFGLHKKIIVPSWTTPTLLNSVINFHQINYCTVLVFSRNYFKETVSRDLGIF